MIGIVWDASMSELSYARPQRVEGTTKTADLNMQYAMVTELLYSVEQLSVQLSEGTIPFKYDLEPKPSVYVEKHDGGESLHYDIKRMIINKRYNITWYGIKMSLTRGINEIKMEEE